MQMFQGFKPEGMKKIQQRMGYTGPADQFQSYLQANPDKQMMMNNYVNKAMNMASGGYVRNFNTGGFNLPEGFNREEYLTANPDVLQAISQGQFSSAEDHYRKFGGGEQRLTQLPEGFDPVAYATKNPDIYSDPASPDNLIPINPETGGRSNADLARVGLDHFRKFGFKEDRSLGGAQPSQIFVPPPADARDEVTQPPPEGTVTQPPPEGTVTQPPPDPNEGLTPEQIHRRNFYASTPEEQAAINARFPFFTLPVGPTDTGVAGVDTTQTSTDTTQPPAGDTVTGATGESPPREGFVNGPAYLANRKDVADAIAAGNTFGVDPATLEGLTPEQRNQRLAQAHFNAFGNTNGINPETGLANAPSNFDGVSDQVIVDYLDQYPDLQTEFGGPPYDASTLARARAHYAQFGRNEIAAGNRPALVQFDLTPEQLQLMRFANDEYKDLTDVELRRTYIAMGGNIPNFDRGATLLNGAQLQLLRDEFDDLSGLNDYELQQHFLQFGRQEMLDGTRKKLPSLIPPVSPYTGLDSIGDISAARLETPVLADGTRLDAQKIAGPDGTVPTGTTISTTDSQLSATDPVAVAGTAPAPSGATAGTRDLTATTTVQDTTKTKDDVQTVTDATKGRTLNFTLGADGKERATPEAAQATAEGTLFEGANLSGETGTATDAQAAKRADITDPEKLKETVVRDEAKTFVEGIVAASADPSASATVAGQLEKLLGDFTLSDPPAWAAGAVRFATAEMARRGLGTSSMAGQAIVQAAMEAALPIAQADAQIQAQFEGQNLSNKQQMAMFYAQQRANFIGKEFDQEFQANVANTSRISEIADLNFNAQQQVVLENSRATNTMDLNNLSNKQAILMAEAATLSQLDMSNLNNRQQAAVQSAQAFLQKDMTDVSNAQQTTLFNAQQRIQSLFTDGAADNARKQFNASSESQTEQFFANLSTQVSQFNDAQKNAIAQFNAGQNGTVSRFNKEIENQRDQFNAQNRLVIDQSNAQWRRQINTTDTAATNRANEINATALLDISNTAYNDLWQYYADAMEFAWTSAENERTRAVNLGIAQLQADNNTNIAELKNDFQSSLGFGSLIGSFLTADSSSFAGSVLNKFLG